MTLYGRPRSELPLDFYDASIWDWSGSGNPRSYTVLPPGQHSLVLCVAGNQFHGNSISGLNCDWTLIGRGDVGGGAESHGDMWLGNPKGPGDKTSVSVTYNNGGNLNGVSLIRIGCPSGVKLLDTSTGSSGAGSITLTPVVAKADGLAIAYIGLQNAIGPIAPAAGSLATHGWSMGIGGRSIVTVGTVPYWRKVKKGETVSFAWTGPAAACFAIMGILAPVKKAL